MLRVRVVVPAALLAVCSLVFPVISLPVLSNVALGPQSIVGAIQAPGSIPTIGGDVPVVGDWDANGTVTPGVFRSGVWYLRNSNTSGGVNVSFSWGAATDVPVVGDWDGNGTTTPGVYREGIWYLRNSNSSGPSDVTFSWGSPTDVPVVGDWNGDGTFTPGVYRNGTWFQRNSNSGGGC